MRDRNRKIEMFLTLSVVAVLLLTLLLVFQGKMATTPTGGEVLRSPDAVTRRFAIAGGIFLLAVFLLPPLLRRRVSGDPFLVPLTLLLSGFGVVTLFSVKDPLRDSPAWEHHLWGLALSVFVMVMMARLTPLARQKMRSYGYAWALMAILLVVGLMLFGQGPEGVRLSLFAFQPVEVIKLLLVFFLAGYLSEKSDLITDASTRWTPKFLANVRRSDGRPTFTLMLPRLRDIGPLVVMWSLALALFLIIRDMGPGALLFAAFVVTLYLATGRGVFVVLGTLLLFGAGYAAYKSGLGVFPTRVNMWLNPFQNAHPNGMQLGQSFWAMASGGASGKGLGFGMPGTMPRAGSDLAFVSWAEETGVVGAWVVLVVFALLVWRGVRIALRAGSDFDRMLAFGLTALLGLQTLLILGGVTGATPLTGLSLPFIAYGNSALIANFAIIGLLRGISAASPGEGGRPFLRPEIGLAARRFTFGFAALLLAGIGLARVARIQVFEADAMAVRAIKTPDADKVVRPHINPRLLTIANQIQRGSIYDRNGRVLATSRPEEIKKLVPNVKQAARLIAEGKRYYPFGEACAHLVGYLDPGVGGPFGLESGYNTELRGFHDYPELLADYRRLHTISYRPRKSLNLHLSLDAAWQRDAQKLLWRTVSKLKDKRDPKKIKDRASFVLLDPKTGDVRVAACLPTFDPNTLTPEKVKAIYAAPDAEDRGVFVNRAVSGLYPPGSTMKIATTACALETMLYAESFAVVCNRVDPEIRWRANGVYYTRRNTRDDAGDPNFGSIALPTGFRVSSNIYFANLAVELGPKTFRDYLIKNLAFRHVPAQPAFDADLPDLGYGQGRMQATPVEMARLAGAVANDGKMMQARYVKRLDGLKDEAHRAELEPKVAGEPMKPTTAAKLQAYMRSVVTGGTARGVFDDLGFTVSGKTGTAQNERADREPHSWFVGFTSPLKTHNRLAFACVVENGGYGKRVAAVICRDVLSAISQR
jgi:cell division protein FtsI/penicillin-binding protein 2/cell division protein FtsW (lipid II flippase)